MLYVGGARVAQWWEHSPPTNVSLVRILASTPYVDWVCCWFSPLLREVFLRVLRFSPLLKNQHFQIQIRSGPHRHVSTSSYELLSAPWVNKLQFTNFFFTIYKFYNFYKFTILQCLVNDTETITNLTYENGNDMSNITWLFVALLLRLHLQFRGWTLLSTDIDSE